MFCRSFSRAVTAHNSLCFPNEKNSPTCPLLSSLGNHTQTDASICLSSISSFFLQSLRQTAGIYDVSLSEERGQLVLEVFNAVGQGLGGYGSQHSVDGEVVQYNKEAITGYYLSVRSY